MTGHQFWIVLQTVDIIVWHTNCSLREVSSSAEVRVGRHRNQVKLSSSQLRLTAHYCRIHPDTNSWSARAHGVPLHRKAQECVLHVHLLCGSVYELCLGPFYLHPAAKHHEVQVYSTAAAPGGRHRQLIFNDCTFSSWRAGTTWNAVWWLNQVVRNQLDETLGIKAAGSTSSLPSVGSFSSEGIKYCFGSQRNSCLQSLWFCREYLWQRNAYTDATHQGIPLAVIYGNKENRESRLLLRMKGLDLRRLWDFSLLQTAEGWTSDGSLINKINKPTD